MAKVKGLTNKDRERILSDVEGLVRKVDDLDKEYVRKIEDYIGRNTIEPDREMDRSNRIKVESIPGEEDFKIFGDGKTELFNFYNGGGYIGNGRTPLGGEFYGIGREPVNRFAGDLRYFEMNKEGEVKKRISKGTWVPRSISKLHLLVYPGAGGIELFNTGITPLKYSSGETEIEF